MAIDIKIGEEEKEVATKSKLNMRKALDGSLMILDHADLDIVIMPEKRKVIALAKEQMDDRIYEIQDDLFKFLHRKGVIDFDSVQSGNIYGALEGTIMVPEDNKLNAIDMTVLMVARWIEKEKPYYEYKEANDEEETERLTDPPAGESTPLGQVPHEKKKGTKTNQLSYTNYQRPYEE